MVKEFPIEKLKTVMSTKYGWEAKVLSETMSNFSVYENQ